MSAFSCPMARSSLSLRRGLVLLAGAALALLCHNAAAQELPEAGVVAKGIGVIPLSLGPTQVFSKAGHASGLRLSAGAQLDLGPRWALRLPVVLAAADGDNGGYAELDVSPAALYRFRYRVDQTFVPYLGVGVKLGLFGADRPFLGKPLLPVSTQVSASDFLHEHHHGSSDPNFDSAGSIGGEALLGVALHTSRLFSVNFEVTGELLPIDGVLVETVAETVALHFEPRIRPLARKPRERVALLTRDAARYQTYFPALNIIAPA